MPEQLFSPDTIITPQMLIEASRDEEAIWLRHLWQEGMDSGYNTVVHGCGDARNWMVPTIGDPGIVSNRAIGTTGIGRRLERMIRHAGVARVMVVGHYDGVLSADKGALAGCGALAAKDALDRGEHAHLSESLEHVHEYVQSPHVVVQTLVTAVEASALGNRPVLAAVMDHRTGRIFPLAVVVRRGQVFLGVDNEELSPTIVKNAVEARESLSIPTEFDLNVLDSDLTMRKFIDMLQHNARYAAQNEATPDFSNRMAVQNPTTAIMSSSVIPLAVRYPRLFSEPNTAFALRIIRDPEGIINPASLREAIAQMNYPISHKLDAQNTDAPFGRTNTIIIETTRESESMRAAAELCNRDWMKEWRQKGGRVIVAKVDHETGVTVHTELYTQGL